MAVEDVPMPLRDHLAELRHRLMIAAGAVLVGFFACYAYAPELFALLLQPLQAVLPDFSGELIFTGLTEPFVVYIKTALVAGTLLAMPVILLQIWLFVRPAFRGNEEKYTTAFVILGGLLFIVGALFGYFLVFPFGFRFLIAFADGHFAPMLAIGEYFSLATKMLFAFGLMFEAPLILLMLARIGVIDAAWLRKNRRFAVLSIFIIAAILTPPDVFSQMMLALPLLVLYEISILVIAWTVPPRAAEVTADAHVPPQPQSPSGALARDDRN